MNVINWHSVDPIPSCVLSFRHATATRTSAEHSLIPDTKVFHKSLQSIKMWTNMINSTNQWV